MNEIVARFLQLAILSTSLISGKAISAAEQTGSGKRPLQKVIYVLKQDLAIIIISSSYSIQVQSFAERAEKRKHFEKQKASSKYFSFDSPLHDDANNIKWGFILLPSQCTQIKQGLLCGDSSGRES